MPTSVTIKLFFRTPKGLLLVILAALVVMASARQHVSSIAIEVAAAVLTAGALDVVIIRVRQHA